MKYEAKNINRWLSVFESIQLLPGPKDNNLPHMFHTLFIIHSMHYLINCLNTNN
jgi:hypothetical protein